MKSPRHQVTPAEASPDLAAPGSPRYRPTAASSRYINRQRTLAHKPSNTAWERLIFQTAVAGFAYPLCVAVALLPFGLFALFAGRPGLAEDALALFIALVITIALALIGYVYALFGSAIASAALFGVFRLLAWRPRWPQLGAFLGALVAYLCTLPWSLSIATALVEQWFNPAAYGWTVGGFGFWIAVTALLGPGLATLVGQVAGARAGLINGRAEQLAARRAARADKEPAAANINPQQFSLRQMLAVTVVVSVVLTLLRLANLLTLPMGLATSFWFVAQLSLRWPAIRLADWLVRKRYGRGAVFRAGVDPRRRPLTAAGTDLERYWR
ncbi:MAG: hypothetical protein AAF596_03760, partial [Planctomycetota bacterium]